MILYSLTIFLSAFLLFQVQPMIAKMILPWFGGTAAVWTTCMLFFQTLLLAGYGYAHWSIRSLTPRRQATVHSVLLGGSLLVLPLALPEAWKPVGTENPVLRMLIILGVAVGLPYFMLSTTSPLIQAWYARTHHTALPYRLFALSNAASMLALLSYPSLAEPLLARSQQTLLWSLAYAIFALLCAAVALRSRTAPATALEQEDTADAKPNLATQLLWVALAACPSTLLLAVTNHLCQNIAAVPFLWILPLALYLLSFILCFGGRGWYNRAWWLRFTAVAMGGMAYALSSKWDIKSTPVNVSLFSLGLFLCCIACHGELAGLKPAPRYLTSFYLMLSLGGALGGIFVGVLAPLVFRTFLELQLGLVACAVLLLHVMHRDPASYFYRAMWNPAWLMLILMTAAMIVALGMGVKEQATGNRVMVRNFYAALRTYDHGDKDEETYARTLTNGTINHGEQWLQPDRRRQATTYYAPASGVGLAILTNRPPQQRIGVIGLGAGVTASYGRPGDYYRYYEINPAVLKLTRTEFTFLADCPAKVDIAMGDARLSLERESPENFDVLAVDAFSSDSIPIHLLTKEAMALYFRHLKSDGILAVHVSNAYLKLEPVVIQLAHLLGKSALLVEAEEDADYFSSDWVLVASRPETLKPIRGDGKEPAESARLRPWTDDYSNLFQVLKWK